MSRVEVEVDYAQDVDERGQLRDATVVVCTDCGREASAFGTSSASFRAACVKLKRECGSSHFYYSDEVEDD